MFLLAEIPPNGNIQRFTLIHDYSTTPSPLYTLESVRVVQSVQSAVSPMISLFFCEPIFEESRRYRL